ncbi:MAG: glycosyltransferase family 2 protein, partial [Phycisphaerae bacterium]|nr:glycosyltransferase family 2 protein [Phycisphaerae bacterium]
MAVDIDLIIPMHNGGATIGAALASLRAQTHRRWRALVIDDGSTDDGPAIVELVAGADRRVRLVRQARAGVAAARNRGLELADATLAMFLDADDWLLPDALRRLAETASDGAAAFGGFEFRDAGGRWLADERPGQAEIGLRELFGQVFLLVHAQALPRRAIGDERFDASLPVVEDTDLWLRLARRGLRWRNTGALLGAYRIRPGARSTDFEGMLACSRRVYDRA